MAIYKRGEVYWLQFKHQGKRVRLSTGQRDLTAAQRAARYLRIDYEEEAGPAGKQGVTLAVLEELDVQRTQQRGLGPRRQATIENLWRNLRRHLGEHRDVATLTLLDLDRYEGKRRQETHRGRTTTGQTIRRERGALIRGLKLAKRHQLIHRYPFDLDELETIRSDPRDERQAGKVWSADQITLVLESLSDKAKTAGHHRMLRLIQRTGMRLEEFRRCGPRWLVAVPTGWALHIKEGGSKTKQSRLVPLLDEDVATIRDLGATFSRRKFNHALKLASEKAGLPGVLTPRDLRKWYLTTAGSSDPLAAQRLGGHTNIATTGLYLEAAVERSLSAGLDAARQATKGSHRGYPQRKPPEAKA